MALLQILNYVVVLVCLLPTYNGLQTEMKEAVESVKKQLVIPPNITIVPNTDSKDSVLHTENQPNMEKPKKSNGDIAYNNPAKESEDNTVPQKQSIDIEKNNVMYVEESNFKEQNFEESIDFPDSLRISFYFFIAISCGAILLMIARVYRMRLTRAERKYGVHGDRSTQELTPLPIAVEDVNSDDEDHTLFEFNRHQIRIL